MKKSIARIAGVCALLALLGVLQGCANTNGVNQESAIEWMARQPWSTIP